MAKRKKTSNEDLPEENQGDLSSSDENFGLPEIEYQPLDRTEPEASDGPVAESSSWQQEETPASSDWSAQNTGGSDSGYTYTPPPPEPVWPKILMAIVLLLVIGGGVWYFFAYAPKQKAEKARIEAEERSAAEARRIAAEKLAAEDKRKRDEEERLRREAEEANAVPVEGNIEVLNARTSRYYVVISSAVDGDLAMDYAKKLSKAGIASKLIPPFGKSKFHRLTIADHDTWAQAQADAESKKGTYGDAVWVIKY